MIDRRSEAGLAWRHAQLDGGWVRLVRLGRAEVLEMRDPNSGQDPEPASKPRHQYVRAGGVLWTRRLPPGDTEQEYLAGDEAQWVDRPGPIRWEPMGPRRPSPRSVIDDYAEAADDLRVAVVRRQRCQVSGKESYVVRGEHVDAGTVDDVEIVAGPITTTWWDVPLPPCPDCGGDLVWWEAGYVPGTRRCLGSPVDHEADGRPSYDTDGGCGSLFSVASEGGEDWR